MINWDMVSALSTIMTGAVAVFALLVSLNPEWIADKKLLRRIEKNRKLKDVCLSIILSRCGIFVIEYDSASCIIVKYRIEQLGWVRKTHLRVAHVYHPELAALESAGMVRRIEQQTVKQWSPDAFDGFQLTGEGNRFFDKVEKHLLKKYPLFERPELPPQLHSPNPEIIWRMNNIFQDEYHLAKVESLRSEILLCAFPSSSIYEPAIVVKFFPVGKLENNEFASAFFSGHGIGFEIGLPLTLQPTNRPVNLGELQFSNLKGNINATTVSVTEFKNQEGQDYTKVGLCYTNEVLNA